MPLRYLLVHKHHVLLVQRRRVKRVLVVHKECPIVRRVATVAGRFCVFDLCRYRLALAVFLRVVAAHAWVVVADAQVLRVGLGVVRAWAVDALL